VITLDTSGFLAVVNHADADHAACREAYETDSGPYVVPAAILAEIDWAIRTRVVEARSRLRIRDAFLGALRLGGLVLDCGDQDFPRIHDLLRRYDDLGLGIADSAVIACAERRGGRVLTTDRRQFPVVARGERTITAVP
jgi:predicted nucleic acid-binding protein